MITDKNFFIQSNLQEFITKMGWLPSPNPNLCRVIASLHNPDCDIKPIEELLAADPSLSSQILRFANSSFYGYRGCIHDTKKAIMVLGLKEIQNICLTVALLNQFKSANIAPSFKSKLFWHHSILTAMLAKDLAATYAPYISKEEIYILGLLHDLGRIALAVYLPNIFEQIIKNYTKDSYLYAVEKTIGITHCELGHIIAKKWGMPMSFATIMLFHHTPQKAMKHIIEVALISMAEHLANAIANTDKLKIEMSTHVSPYITHASNLLHISEDDYQNLLNNLPTISEKAIEMLQQFI